ncbi:MAG: HAMP domain-containing histidine kinase [Euryhalocaulis sp.]|uniref:sensor histidine kinase n=1 Tax=Euryhalocaulis sp. TaxID=2744307 RepID=UPI00180312C2|nr:HAMP domain-containing sensor histidine kinase [Euryhalocaulis sp.]MBA4800347.1 HAMP domain-containing histidine kinase [Euryhalocaulis sp.]
MNFWRASSHLRLAAYFAALLTASGMIVFGATYFAIAASSKNTLRQLVDTDLAGLVELYAVEGVEGLEQRIGDRLKLRPAQGAEAFYLFADGEGAILAGNLPDWPDGARLDSSLFEATFPGPDGPVRVVGRATILRGDYGLLVARSEEVRRAALAQLRAVFALGTLLTLLAAGAGGWWIARRFHRRVETINDACQAVRDGDMERRAPGAERPDEIGLMALNVNQMLDRIETLLTIQKQTTDQLAHELRTPLTRLAGQLTALEADLPEGETSRARDEIRRLTALLDSLLDLSAMQAQTGDARGLAEFDLSALAYSMGDIYEASAEAAGVALSVEAEAGVMVRGDAQQFARLIANLLDNALKFSPEGGRVRLTVAPGPRLTVGDDGPGVPEALREKVFERFSRGQPGDAPGHGLGLALVRAIAERHGLSARIADSPRGALFVISA